MTTFPMSDFELAYLTFVVTAFIVFAGTLAVETYLNKHDSHIEKH